MKMICDGAGTHRRSNAGLVTVVVLATLSASASAQPTRVMLRATPDTAKYDSAHAVSAKQSLLAILRKVDSLAKRLDGLTIGSPEYARTNDELLATLKSSLPGVTLVMTQDGSFTFDRFPVEAARAKAVTGRLIEVPVARAMGPDVEPRGWIGINTDGVVVDWVEPDGHYYRNFVYPVVVGVTPNSPAAKVGVQFGDSLIAYNGMDLRGATLNFTRLLQPNVPLKVSLRRDGEAKELSIIPERVPQNILVERRSAEMSRMLLPSRAPMPGDTVDRVFVENRVGMGGRGIAVGSGGMVRGATAGAEAAPLSVRYIRGPVVGMRTSYGLLGAAMTDLTSAAVTALTQQKQSHGVLVQEVPAGSPAARMGIRDGDIIVSVGEAEVISLSQLARELNVRGSSRATQFVVFRQGKTEKLTYEPR